MKLYRLQPAYSDYVWGGTNLIENWGKKPPSRQLAESWEISLHPEGESRVTGGIDDGKPLSQVLTRADWGENCQNFPIFPLMVRLVDAGQNLSIQVHPDDAFAQTQGEMWGKTEMWFVLESKPGSGIYCGFKQPISREEFAERIQDSTIIQALRFIELEQGQAIKIDAGTVHAICAGLTVVEVNQNSNSTYRIYDYDRKDTEGNPRRPLHIEEAKAVSRLSPYTRKNNKVQMEPGKTLLCASRCFSVYEYNYNICTQNKKDTDLTALIISVDKRSFCTLTFLEGEGSLNGQSFSKGNSFLATAGDGLLKIEGTCRFILTKVVKYFVKINIDGKNTEGVVCDQDSFLLSQNKTAIQAHLSAEQIIQNLVEIIAQLLDQAGLDINDVEGIDIGIPNDNDDKAGIGHNFGSFCRDNVPIHDILKTHYNLPIRITNEKLFYGH